MYQSKFSGAFLEPVNTDIYPSYLGLITIPMDLGTIGKKLKTGTYVCVWMTSCTARGWCGIIVWSVNSMGTAWYLCDGNFYPGVDTVLAKSSFVVVDS